MGVVSREAESRRGGGSSWLLLGKATVCLRDTGHGETLEKIRRAHRSSCKHGVENWLWV